MKKTALLILTILALLGTLASTAALGAGANHKTKNVIVAVMDGVRWVDTFGDLKRELIPNLTALEKDGTLFANCRISGPGISVTRQGHSTISTGTWQRPSLGGGRMSMPTFFEYARNELGWAEKDCWAIFGKGQYSYCRYSSFPTYGQKYMPSFVIGIGENVLEDDPKVLEKVFQVMDTDRPKLIFVNFGVSDHLGHQPLKRADGTSPEIGSPEHYADYKAGIKNCDAMFGKLWAKVQSTPGYKDSTTVFFTNDHGRHTDGTKNGFVAHGDTCDGCRHIMLFAIGPDVKRGTVVDKETLEIDICPTVGELLGFQTPLADGSVLKDCLVTCEGVNQKLARTPEAQQGLELKKLAERDMVKVVADRALTRDPSSLTPSVDAEVFLRGLIEAARVTKNAQYRDYAQAWAEKHKGEAADPRVARILLELAADGVNKDAYLAAAKACGDNMPPGGDPVEAQFSAGFLARLAQVTGETNYLQQAKTQLRLEGKTQDDLVKDWRARKIKPVPMACDVLAEKPSTCAMLADAARFTALSDAAMAAPKDEIVRAAYDIQECICSQGLVERGSLWPYPALSALILRDVSLRAQMQAKHPVSWEKGGATAKEKSQPIWGKPAQNFTMDEIPLASDLLKLQVDKDGTFAKEGILTQGAAMLLFSQTAAPTDAGKPANFWNSAPAQPATPAK